MEFGQLHHVEYYVNDLKTSNAFWDWFMPELGYKKYSEWASGVSWIHPSGTYLCFVQVADDYLKQNNNRQGSGLNHIAFMGNSAEQVDKLERELRGKGLVILHKDKEQICFEDPNRFAIEVYVP